MTSVCTRTHTHMWKESVKIPSLGPGRKLDRGTHRVWGCHSAPTERGQQENAVLVVSSLVVNSPVEKFKCSVPYWKESSLLHAPPEPLTLSARVPGKGVTIQGVGLQGADLDLRGCDASVVPPRVHPGRGLQ